MTAGVTLIVALRADIVFNTPCAAARQSAAVAPGTIPRRLPSYTAFSTLWRIMFTRENSSAAKKKRNKIGAQIANSTVTTPQQARRMLRRQYVCVVVRIGRVLGRRLVSP